MSFQTLLSGSRGGLAGRPDAGVHGIHYGTGTPESEGGERCPACQPFPHLCNGVCLQGAFLPNSAGRTEVLGARKCLGGGGWTTGHSGSHRWRELGLLWSQAQSRSWQSGRCAFLEAPTLHEAREQEVDYTTFPALLEHQGPWEKGEKGQCTTGRKPRVPSLQPPLTG